MGALFWILSHTPLKLAWALGWACAWLWWTIIPFRRSLAINGYHRAFPDRPPGADLRRMFAGLVLGYFELFREMRVAGSVKVDYSGQEDLLAELASGEGSFLLSGHFDSWDLVGPMICRDLSLPASVIVKTPKNAAMAGLIKKIRTAFGMGLLPVKQVMERVYEEVGRGRQVVFLLDQRLNRGIPAEFFGAPGLTSPALAQAARKSGKHVYTLWFTRIGIGRHRAEIGPPLALSGDIAADTRCFMQFYEERIRQVPHNWLWLHDRWRGGTTAGAVPANP